MRTYEDKTVLVTGASKGIGRALAKKAARRGANVVLTARSEDLLEFLAAEIREEHGVEAMVIASNLASAEDAEYIHSRVLEAGVHVDVLANVAGLGRFGPFLQRPITDAEDTINVDVTALVALTHAFGKDFAAERRGGIINVGSLSGYQPVPYQAVYAASKALVLSFTYALRYELASSGVDVMVVSPGNTRTSFLEADAATSSLKHADTADRVAAQILNDFVKGRAQCIPGTPLHRLTSWGERVLPRGTLTKIAAAWSRKAGFDNLHLQASGSPR